MALFKTFRGNEANLPTTKTDGYCYFCADTGRFFIDYKDSTNTVVRKMISAECADKLRYTGADNEMVEIDPATIITQSYFTISADGTLIADAGTIA